MKKNLQFPNFWDRQLGFVTNNKGKWSENCTDISISKKTISKNDAFVFLLLMSDRMTYEVITPY